MKNNAWKILPLLGFALVASDTLGRKIFSKYIIFAINFELILIIR